MAHAQLHPNTRLFVPDVLAQDAIVTLDKPQTHYLTSVMRLKEGAGVALFNGREGEWWGKLLGTGGKQAQVICEHQARVQAAEPDVWLLFAPIKFGKIDFLVQKVTELGIAELYPVQTARTVVSRLNDDRLEANAMEAAEQSERLTVPTIHDYQKLTTLLANWPQDRLLIYGDETHQGKLPAELLPPLKGQKLALLIGPEGGFSPEELAQLRKMPNARAMSLGPRILRADTAALAALTCVMALTGEW